MNYVRKCRRDCPDRKVGCHEGCGRYEEDREDDRRRREYRQKHTKIYGSTISQYRDQVEKVLGKRPDMMQAMHLICEFYGITCPEAPPIPAEYAEAKKPEVAPKSTLDDVDLFDLLG